MSHRHGREEVHLHKELKELVRCGRALRSSCGARARQAGIPVLIGSIGLGFQMRGESGIVQGAGISKRQLQTIYQRESTCGTFHRDSPKHRYHAGRFCC